MDIISINAKMISQATAWDVFNSKIESERIKIAQLLYDFYVLNIPKIKEHIENYMLNSTSKEHYVLDTKTNLFRKIEGKGMGMFSAETAKIYPKTHYDLVSKILKLTCILYQIGCDRYLVDEDGEIDEKQTDLMTKLYEEANISLKQNDYYKLGSFFNTIAVQPVWRNKMELDIYAPNIVSVITKENNYLEVDKLILKKKLRHPERNRYEDMFVVWTEIENYIEDSAGHKFKPAENNKEMTNPFGGIPFEFLRFMDSDNFWGYGQQDLVENNIWYDIREANQYFVEMFQGIGVGLGINLGREGDIALRPNTMITADHKNPGIPPPSLSFTSTGAPLTELGNANDRMRKLIGNTKGISPGTLSNDISEASGRAKQFDNQEMEITTEEQKLILKDFEKRLFRKFRIVYNTYTEGIKLKENLELKIDFKEYESVLTISDEIQKWEFEFKNGFKSKIDYLVAKNSDLTYEQAEEILTQVLEENKKYGNDGKANIQREIITEQNDKL